MSERCQEAFWAEIAPCEHLLQIYEEDGVLLDTLTGFVGGGLRAGEGVIVIATLSHLSNLDNRLEAADIDVYAARARDQYIPLEAEAALKRFVVHGWPDEVRFAETIGAILTRAKRNGRKVRAFGEMVALLWARGETAATVRLEHLWNKLSQAEEFSLFCAYPKVCNTQGAAASMHEICAAHSRIISAN